MRQALCLPPVCKLFIAIICLLFFLFTKNWDIANLIMMTVIMLAISQKDKVVKLIETQKNISLIIIHCYET